MAASIEDFCRRIQAGLANASFTQRRTLVELLVDRVLVINDQVEIRYVVPTLLPARPPVFVICVKTISNILFK